MLWKVTELAAHLGLTSNRVHQLANDGLFPRLDDGKKFDSVECVKAYIEHLRGKTKSAVEEKARLDKLRADKVEMEIAIAKAELMNPDEAMEAWSKVVQSCRSRILSIPTKAAPLLIGTKSAGEAQDILQRLVNEALKELANPDLVDVAMGAQAERRKRNQKRRKA
jgi:hypothetical protein